MPKKSSRKTTKSPKRLASRKTTKIPKRLASRKTTKIPKRLVSRKTTKSPKRLSSRKTVKSPKRLASRKTTKSPKRLASRKSPKRLDSRKTTKSPKRLDSRKTTKSPKRLASKEPEINLDEMKKRNFEVWFRYHLKNMENLDWIDNSDYALSFYKTDVGAYILNNYLRNIQITPPKDSVYINIHNIFLSGGAYNVIKYIDESMNNNQKGVQVFRGIRNDKNFNLRTGGSYIEESYSSVTTNFCVANKFINKKCCILSLRIPDNILSYDFKNSDQQFHSNEDEILIEKNIVYHIGNPSIINDVCFYPCVITRKENIDPKYIDLELKKQNDFLIDFKKEYKRLKSGTAEEILENLEKNRLYKFLPLLPNFDGDYNRLCLDNTMKEQVYELVKKKYGNKNDLDLV
jgi:hypothetical protein